MLKRVTLLVFIIIFAKPAYEFVKPYIAPLLNDTEVETLIASTVQPNDINMQQADIVETDATLPNAVDSVESLADAIYYHLSNFETAFSVKYSGNTGNIDKIIESASELASKRDPYIDGHLAAREVTYTYSKVHAKIDVKQQYLITAEQAASVDATVDDILAKNNAYDLSDYEKVKFVNDYIVKNTEYSTETKNTPHSAYTVLAEGKAVCQGYALLAQKMLTKLGIESLYVVGEAGGIGHAWNLVKLDDNWYHLDTTWNDPAPDRGPASVRYSYFLLSDNQLAKDHVWEHSDYPTAKNESYSYLHNVTDSYEVDDYIYFSNDEDNNHLYRLNKASKEKEKVANIRVQYLTGQDEWLYFSNYSNGGYLTKMNLNGNDMSYLVKDSVKNIFVYDNFIYFTTDEGNRKLQLN